MQARTLTILGLTLTAASCGGNNPSAGDSAPADASPGGIWRGTDAVTGLNVIGVISESGDLRLIRTDRVQYVGTAHVSGAVVSGDLESFPERGSSFTDGSVHATGTISGRVTERETLQVTLVTQTDNGTASTSSVSLSYDQTYEKKSSLASVVGDYIEAATGTLFAVDANGHFSAREAATGCVVDGNVSIIDADYNLYGVAYTYSACEGAAAILNGVTASGLGTVNAVATASQTVVYLTYEVSGRKVSLVVEMNRV